MNHLSTYQNSLIGRLSERNIDFFALYAQSVHQSPSLRTLPTFNDFWGGINMRILESYFGDGDSSEKRLHTEESEVYSVAVDYGLSLTINEEVINSPKGGFSCMLYST